MHNNTLSNFKLQDVSQFNFNRRVKKRGSKLIERLRETKDGRDSSGLRHPLSSILFIVFSGMMEGKSSVKDCYANAVSKRKWIGKYVPLPYGIPVETTISRALEKADPISVQEALVAWQEVLGGSVSADGKTGRGIKMGDIRHILSLFSHDLRIISQEGVKDKENEIPAMYRLLGHTNVEGMLILSDALHTQTETAKRIIEAGADYLLQVKRNQKTLHTWLSELFQKQSVNDFTLVSENKRGRDISTLCLVITDPLTCSLFHSEWVGVKSLVCIHRYGMREGKYTDEWVYWISSRKLTATDALTAIRNHWCIENNLHWRKDYTYREDEMRASKGSGILTSLRSMCISIIESVKFKSFSDAVKGFRLYPNLLHRFMYCVGII